MSTERPGRWRRRGAGVPWSNSTLMPTDWPRDSPFEPTQPPTATSLRSRARPRHSPDRLPETTPGTLGRTLRPAGSRTVAATGTRLPRNTQAPPAFSGCCSTAVHLCQFTMSSSAKRPGVSVQAPADDNSRPPRWPPGAHRPAWLAKQAGDSPKAPVRQLPDLCGALAPARFRGQEPPAGPRGASGRRV